MRSNWHEPPQPDPMEGSEFDMDGTDHITGDKTCCSGEGEHIPCGGLWHYQAMYGSYYYECDRCHQKNMNGGRA